MTHKTVLFEKFEILECLKKDVGAGVYRADHIYLGKQILLQSIRNSDSDFKPARTFIAPRGYG